MDVSCYPSGCLQRRVWRGPHKPGGREVPKRPPPLPRWKVRHSWAQQQCRWRGDRFKRSSRGKWRGRERWERKTEDGPKVLAQKVPQTEMCQNIASLFLHDSSPLSPPPPPLSIQQHKLNLSVQGKCIPTWTFPKSVLSRFLVHFQLLCFPLLLLFSLRVVWVLGSPILPWHQRVDGILITVIDPLSWDTSADPCPDHKVLGWPKSLFRFFCKIKDTFFTFTNNFIDSDILSMVAISHVVEHWLFSMSQFDHYQFLIWSTRPWSIIQWEISGSTKLRKPLLTRSTSHSAFSIHCKNLFSFFFVCIFTFLELIQHNMLESLQIFFHLQY